MKNKYLSHLFLATITVVFFLTSFNNPEIETLNNKLKVEIRKNDLSKSGKEDGLIFIEISGGVAPYTTTIFDRSGSNQKTGSKIDLKNLSAGKYKIVVQDFENQTEYFEVLIGEEK